jgi:hypothetical protein
MTTPKQSFRLIDDYAREHYRCFLAEMFQNQGQTEYMHCFRRTRAANNSDRYACRYLCFEISEIRTMEQTHELNDSVKSILDKELPNLNLSA